MMRHSNQRLWIFALLTFTLLAGCAATPTRQSTGEFIDDAAITTSVKTALLADKEVSGTAVNVETFKGVVQLSGFVKSQHEKEHAAAVTARVKGVKAVRNDLNVK